MKAVLFEGSSGKSRLRLIVSLCFAAVAAIGALGTVAWVTGHLTLAQINPLFVPIAPLTILIMVSLGASWFVYALRSEYDWSRSQAAAVGVLIVMLMSLTIYHAVMPGSFSIENTVFPNSVTLQGYPIARISPLTAVMFLLGGFSLILLVSFSGTRTRAIVALCGMVILSCGVVTSIGYFYQAPLLYGSPIIPVSIPAAIAFLFLGTEIWASAGRECWPTRSLVGNSVQARLMRAFLPVTVLILVIFPGLDEILGNIYEIPLVGSLGVLAGLAVMIIVIGKLSSGIGAELDQGMAERTRMEKTLQESEEKYRAMVENSPNLIGIFQDGVLKYVNSAAILKLGWTYEELVSTSFDPIVNVVAPKSRSLLKENVGKRLRGEEIAPYEISLTKKDKSEVPVWVRGTKIIYNQKPAIEFVFDDITERKRTEEKLKLYSLHLEELVGKRTSELRESEKMYRELFEASPVSLWEEDYTPVKLFLDELRRRGVSDLGSYLANHPEDVTKCATLVKVIRVNKATLNLYDAKSVDEIAGGLAGLLTEQANHVFAGALVALSQGKTHYEAEIENRTLHGETKHCNVICAVVPGLEQSLTRVLTCIVDLTLQKKLESELVKSQRLAAIGETAAMVGHDLRNPLQGIAGALHLLRQESLTLEERNEMLQVIDKDLHYSDAIIRDLSDYSAEIYLKLAEASPNSIPRDAIDAIEIPRSVRVQDLSEDQPTLRVDPDRMKRVFINLIQNSIDAMPQGGTLTISSKQSNGAVEFTIADTGSGMPKEIMEHLWKPLQTTKATGMGLGLAVCKRIVDAHGGTISVKGKTDEGTTVTIRLPINLDAVEVKQK